MTVPRNSTGQTRYGEEAACRPYPTRWWFSDGPESAEAYLICTGCPVRRECLAFALDHPDLAGIWAATTADDRVALRRRARHPSTRAQLDLRDTDLRDTDLRDTDTFDA